MHRNNFSGIDMGVQAQGFGAPVQRHDIRGQVSFQNLSVNATATAAQGYLVQGIRVG
jgi:hypothetical protein